MTAHTVDRIITDSIFGRAGAFRHNRASNYFLSACARLCFADWAAEERLPPWESLIDIKTSRSPKLMADFLMTEIGAAERSTAVIFAQALIEVAKGDEIRPGMICRFIGWEWRPYFLARQPGNLWRTHGREHATRQHKKELTHPMGGLALELRAYLERFGCVVGRPPESREPPPEWLGEYAALRIGAGIQRGFDLGGGPLNPPDQRL